MGVKMSYSSRARLWWKWRSCNNILKLEVCMFLSREVCDILHGAKFDATMDKLPCCKVRDPVNSGILILEKVIFWTRIFALNSLERYILAGQIQWLHVLTAMSTIFCSSSHFPSWNRDNLETNRTVDFSKLLNSFCWLKLVVQWTWHCVCVGWREANFQ